jgi:hypothetical protein
MSMSTEEWIARGALGVLSFIVVIIWLRWEGPRENQKKPGDQKKDEPPEEPKDQAENG